MRIFCSLSTLFLSLLIQIASAQSRLQTGIWRGELKTKSGNLLPFNFDVQNATGKQILYIHNSSERFRVTDIREKGDSVFIHMPLFNSEFKLVKNTVGLKGNWIKHYADHDMLMAFTATPGINWRFFGKPAAAKYNISGLWTAVFTGSNGKPDTTVGDFKQNGSYLSGTFLTTTGDYRYLEGNVSGNKLYLSTFDGGHAFIFTADIGSSQGIVNGKYYDGFDDIENWTAYKNPKAQLPDAYSLTYLKPGYKKITFSFADLNGKKVSLSDPKFKNKVVIIQMMGSWCPNCMDETNFLVNNYYPKYHAKGVEIIGLAYERTPDFNKSKATLLQLKKRFNIPYTLLITGYTPNRGDPMKSLPMLADYKGFPTTIIIDKKGNVSKIHTGFSGPGTGKYYTEFIAEFEKLTDNLLAEK
ncbi:MAG TPA: TlpA disulfide reductase family protein [Mucilaginibacter sp.]|nr:TlpA disulfide reductase family protein [Mucilaginibacter sp.]